SVVFECDPFWIIDLLTHGNLNNGTSSRFILLDLEEIALLSAPSIYGNDPLGSHTIHLNRSYLSPLHKGQTIAT
ncbi:MAG: hypothetical protein AAFR66_13620, partial [Bacteroidota bacterium]